MSVFLDTSAILPLIDRDDPDAGRCWEALRRARSEGGAVTNNYVVVESVALAARRIGRGAAHALLDGFFPAIEVGWIDRALHDEASAAFVAAKKAISFVDQVCFVFMQREGLTRAIALDRDFSRAGFEVVPG